MKQYLLPHDGHFYKVNMHSHTTLTDGHMTPQEVKDAYMAKGYSAVAFTEHEFLFDVSYLNDENFVALHAFEYGIHQMKHPVFPYYEGKIHQSAHGEAVHLNLYAKDPKNLKMVCFNPDTPELEPYVKRQFSPNTSYVGTPDFVRSFDVENLNVVIKTARENGFLVIYNHPAWSMNRSELYCNLENLTGMEIINGGSDRSSDLDCQPIVYDQMSRTGKRLICVAGDDNHRPHHIGISWTMVKAPALSYENLIENIEKGNCYASNGPEIFDLFVEDGKVTVKTSDARGIFLTTAGRRKEYALAESDDAPITTATFTISPEDYMFRVTVRDMRGNHAFTRYYFLDELTEAVK